MASISSAKTLDVLWQAVRLMRSMLKMSKEHDWKHA